MINKIACLFVFVFSFIYCSSQPDYTKTERFLGQADSLWNKGKNNDALQLYLSLWNDTSISENIRSTIGLRICENYLQSNRRKECAMFLNDISALDYIPEDHQIKLKEIEELIINNRLPDYYKETITKKSNPVARFYISDINARNHFKNIEQAIDSVESLLLKNPEKGAIEIIFTQPNYRFTNSLTFKDRKISSSDNPLIIRSMSETGRTTFDGGHKITKWRKEKDKKILSLLPKELKGKIYVADLKENGISYDKSIVFRGYTSTRSNGINGSISMPVPELFHKGKMQQMSRWPDKGYKNADIHKYNESRTALWADDTEIWFHGYWRYKWADGYEKLHSIDKNGCVRLEDSANRYGFADAIKDSCRWAVINALSEISIPGEWKISATDGKLWYYAPDDFDNEEMVLSVGHWPLTFSGNNDITLRNIDFKNIQGDALIINNCTNALVYDCNFTNISGNAITFNYVTNALVHSVDITNCGRTGIYLWGGDDNTLRSNKSAIVNCSITDFSVVDRTYSPAIHLKGVGTVVENCRFENGPSSAIIAQGKKFIIQRNEFSRCVLESDDQGAIDCWGNPLDRGTVIRHNYFHDIGGSPERMAAAIRLDDVMCGFCINENIFINSGKNVFGSVSINGGQHNRIENNFFIEKDRNITIANWTNKAWKNAITENKSYAAEIKKGYYKDSLWQSVFPKLKYMKDEPNRNYIIGNVYSDGDCVTNSYARNNSIEINNSKKTDLNGVKSLDEITPFLNPWNRIPLSNIGPYKR